MATVKRVWRTCTCGRSTQVDNRTLPKLHRVLCESQSHRATVCQEEIVGVCEVAPPFLLSVGHLPLG